MILNNAFEELGLPIQAKYQKGWLPLIAAGASMIGQYLGNERARNDAVWDTNQANIRQQEWTAQQNQTQMDFQEYMSNTAHSREMRDLQSAGLNPVLAAGGSGSSTPSGASNSMNFQVPGGVQQTNMPGIMDIISLSQSEQRLNNETNKSNSEVLKNAVQSSYTEAQKRQLEGSGLKFFDRELGELLKGIKRKTNIPFQDLLPKTKIQPRKPGQQWRLP